MVFIHQLVLIGVINPVLFTPHVLADDDRAIYIDISCFLQVERPLTMKKDGIQTRNRKLSAKSKKKRAGMADFFRSGLDGRYGWGMGMGMGSGYSLTSPMSGYYHQVRPKIFRRK